MIKHPENCGINHGSRCSCGMSELQAECDRLKEENGEQHRTIAFVNKEFAFRRSECDRLKEENSKQLDFIDLMQDEFQRIRTISVHPEYGNSEIEGLCERAIKNTEQHIPVIKQRDDAQKALLAFRLDNEKWKSIADKLAEDMNVVYCILTDDWDGLTPDNCRKDVRAYITKAIKSYNAVKGGR